MTDDYYSYKPLLRLDRAVVLAGFPGCRPMQTARVTAMLVGLETIMLPHQVMHVLDLHPEALLLKRRDAELHRAELKLLNRSLKKRSRPMIAIGPTTLEDPGCRAWIKEHATLVHLRQTLPEAVQAIQAEASADARKHKHLTVYGGYDVESLASIYSLRTGLLQRQADIEVNINGRDPLTVGKDLPNQLDWDVRPFEDAK